jgi:hypothetical protein
LVFAVCLSFAYALSDRGLRDVTYPMRRYHSPPLGPLFEDRLDHVRLSRSGEPPASKPPISYPLFTPALMRRGVRLRRHIRYRRFFYDVVYDVVAPHQVDTTSYPTSYSRLTQCQVDTISIVSNDMIIRHCYNILYGLPGAVGVAGAAAGHTGHVPAPPTAPAS